MDVTLEQFSSLISQIYGAALDPTRWQEDSVSTDTALEEINSGALTRLIQSGEELGKVKRYLSVGGDALGQQMSNELLRLLMPHLQRSMLTRLRLRQLEAHRGCLLSLSKYAQHGVILATRGSQVLFINPVAMKILAQYKEVEMKSGELHCAGVTQQAMLKRLLFAAGGLDTSVSHKAGSFCLRRPNNQRSLALHILPIGSGDDNGYGLNAEVMIMIVDPDSDPEPQESTLRRLYGLTKAEAMVAVRVTRGEGLQMVADELRVSLSTVRIHLQRVFEKTDTHRQAELVRLLLAVQAGIRMPDD